MAFASMGQNNTLLKMSPKPTYWLVAAKDIQQNEVLDASVTTGAVKFVFPGGKPHAYVELNDLNTWSDPKYSATPPASIAVVL